MKCKLINVKLEEETELKSVVELVEDDQVVRSWKCQWREISC